MFLKGTNDGSNAKTVTLNKLELQYQNTTSVDISGIRAFRAAVLATDADGDAWSTQITTPAGLKTIYAPENATNFSANKAVGKSGQETSPSLKPVTYNVTASTVTIGSIAPGATEYFRVQVRLYVEGEDSTCLNSIFANKNADWKFDIGFAVNAAQVSALTISQITA